MHINLIIFEFIYYTECFIEILTRKKLYSNILWQNRILMSQSYIFLAVICMYIKNKQIMINLFIGHIQCFNLCKYNSKIIGTYPRITR